MVVLNFTTVASSNSSGIVTLPYKQVLAASTATMATTVIQVYHSVPYSATCEWWWWWHFAVAKVANKGGVNAAEGNSCIANLSIDVTSFWKDKELRIFVFQLKFCNKFFCLTFAMYSVLRVTYNFSWVHPTPIRGKVVMRYKPSYTFHANL